MGAYWNSIDEIARLVLQGLLNSVWQGMLIAATIGLLLRVFRSLSATTRHAVWLVTLLTISALPLIGLLNSAKQPEPIAVPSSRVAVSPALPVESSALVNEVLPLPEKQALGFSKEAIPAQEKMVEKQAVPPAGMARPLAAAEMAAPAPAKPGIWRRLMNGSAPMAIVGLWLALALLMCVRILRSYAAISRLRRQLRPAPIEQRTRIERMAESFGIRRPVSLFTSPAVSMPLTIGSVKPVVILPPDLSGNLSQGELDSVLAHELAHILRWDYLSNLLQRFIQAALFFHPAVWFIGKQLSIERELACDDWAVKMCEPRRYASCLARLVEILNESKPRAAVRLAASGILFGKHVITRRVEMILDRDRNATTAVSKSALFYTIGLALSFIVVCSMLQPVVAVPTGQKPAKQKPKKEAPAAASPATREREPIADAAPPADIMPFIVDGLTIEAPLPPEPPDALEAPAAVNISGVAVIDDVDDLIGDLAPLARIQPAAPPVAVYGLTGQQPLLPPRPAAPVAALGPAAPFEWGQDDKNKTPAIPEAELLSLLSDIVKKDADPAVRNEALQGIYRMRSDAAINTLLGLYDSVSDVKVKSEIIAYLIRRNGDNSKAIAKLTSIAKSEQNEELRNRAIRYLGAVKGDDGAATLIQIYDSLQDQKSKLYVVRSLGANKSRKAIDKLMAIAKNDTDPSVRQSAIRALYGIDNRLYLDLLDGNRARIGELNMAPRAFEFNSDKFRESWDRQREMLEKLRIEKFDQLNLAPFEMLKKLEIEIPKIEFQLKELEFDQNQLNDLEGKLNMNRALIESRLSGLRKTPEAPRVDGVLRSIDRQLAMVKAKKQVR